MSGRCFQRGLTEEGRPISHLSGTTIPWEVSGWIYFELICLYFEFVMIMECQDNVTVSPSLYRAQHWRHNGICELCGHARLSLLPDSR